MGFIGVIDSGVGGLTVLQRLRQNYPYDFTYVADHAYCPYGTKPNEVVLSRASKLVEYLKKQGAQGVVLACNTMSVYADKLRQLYGIPIYEVITPTCKNVIESKAKTVVLLATKSTIANGTYQAILSQYGIQVHTFDCSDFVPYVEQCSATSIACQRVVYDALHELPKMKVDAVVLGCTHFPLLRRQISYYCADTRIVECCCYLPSDITDVSTRGKTAYYTTGNVDFANDASSWYKVDSIAFKHLLLP